MDESLSKKELSKLKHLRELEAKNMAARQSMVKWIVIGVVSVLFLAFFSFLIFSVKQNKVKVAQTTLARNGWVRGTGNVTLLEYGDLQCPACKAYEPIVEQVSKDYKGKVKLIFKHFPLTQVHKNAMVAAEFAEAAGRQGKFWEVHDLLYQKQDEWGESDNAQSFFDKYAQSLHLNPDQIHKDMKDPAIVAKINQNEDDGTAAGVDATPTFFLNNNKLDNPASYADMKAIIDKVLKNG